MSTERPPIVAGNFAIMTYMQREFVFFPIEQNELVTLSNGYTPIHFGLFGLCFGGLLTLLVTVLTVPLSWHMKLGFWLAVLVFFLAGLYCGAMAKKAYSDSENLVERIRKSQITTSIITHPSE
jgi:hypothetical protein